ncbi:hypothetical protein A1354_11910 [Pseudomonas asplenii]|nr:hypothetical protein A1354_11910 [Pseudomonas asplenii]
MSAVISACLEIATKYCRFAGLARLAGVQTRDYAQSIIGATEKRRESGAGCRGIGGVWIRGAKVGEFIRIGIGRRLTRRYYVLLLATEARQID